MSPENKKQPKIHEIQFMPEGYLDPDQPELLEQLLHKLHESGIYTTNLLYSGMDGKNLYAADGSIHRPEAIFAMNETGWRKAIEQGETTPAGYVKKDADLPIIALFDGTQLSEPLSYELKQDPDDYWDIVKIVDIKPKPDATPVQAEDDVEEVVIHKNYPDQSPADALVGIVLIQEETYDSPRDHGL